MCVWLTLQKAISAWDSRSSAAFLVLGSDKMAANLHACRPVCLPFTLNICSGVYLQQPARRGFVA